MTSLHKPPLTTGHRGWRLGRYRSSGRHKSMGCVWFGFSERKSFRHSGSSSHKGRKRRASLFFLTFLTLVHTRWCAVLSSRLLVAISFPPSSPDASKSPTSKSRRHTRTHLTQTHSHQFVSVGAVACSAFHNRNSYPDNLSLLETKEKDSKSVYRRERSEPRSRSHWPILD